MRAFPETLCWLLTLLAAGLCSCFVPFEVECGLDAHCNRFSGGVCHTNPQTERRWCSYPDPACSTGYRYSDLDVGDGVSAVCTEEMPPPGPTGRCDPSAEFGAPVLVPNINSSFNDSMSMTQDELSAYISRDDGSSVMLTSTRASTTEAFAPPTVDTTLDAILSAAGIEYLPSSTTDGLLVYFQRYISTDTPRMFVSERSAQGDVFDEGSPIFTQSGGSWSAAEAALFPAISSDGQTLYWIDYYKFKLLAATRQHSHSVFSEPLVLSTFELVHRALSADVLTLYYSSGLEVSDILVSTRISKADPFEKGVLVPNVNSAEADAPLFLTSDGCLLYLTSNRSGGLGGVDIWVARRPR